MCMGEGQSTEEWVSQKTDSPSHSNHHLPVTPQLVVGFHEALPHIYWHFSWLDFV